MKTLEINRTTPVIQLAEELRDLMIAKEATREDHSGTAFTGIPIGQRLAPFIDEHSDNGFGMLTTWLVIAGKRAFLYAPSNEDTELLCAIGGDEFRGEKSDCLDVAKIVFEVPFKDIKKAARRNGWTKDWKRRG